MVEGARGCGTRGCGPAVVVSLPVIRGPWRGRRSIVCWVCERPLDPAEVREANIRWARTVKALAARVTGGSRG